MEKPKRILNPLTISLTEDLLRAIVEVGTGEVLGYKLCQFHNDFDVDEGRMKVSVRVCGGPQEIECQCAKVKSVEVEEIEHRPLTVDDTYREDEF